MKTYFAAKLYYCLDFCNKSRYNIFVKHTSPIGIILNAVTRESKSYEHYRERFNSISNSIVELLIG